MEANLKERKMKMTKEALAAEYVTAISTIESKDSEINEFKGRIAELAEEKKKLTKELAELTKSDYAKVKEERDSYKKEVEGYKQALSKKQGIEDIIKENNDLKDDIQALHEENVEIRLALGEMIDLMESNFQHLSSTVNTVYSGFNILRNRALRKYQKEEGKK